MTPPLSLYVIIKIEQFLFDFHEGIDLILKFEQFLVLKQSLNFCSFAFIDFSEFDGHGNCFFPLVTARRYRCY